MSACPSCGRRVFASITGSAKAERPRAPLVESTANHGAPDHESDEPEVDLELSEVDVLSEAVEPDPADDSPKPEVSVAASPMRRLPVEPGPAVFHLSAAQVRTLVTEQPDLLENGLEIHRDKKNQPVGVDFRTPVGAIDLLARDADGDFVIVAIPDPRDIDTLMPDMLARIGYVRKHLASPREAVRGIVVIEEIPEELAYAVAGIGQTISFKAFRVALTFHELAI